LFAIVHSLPDARWLFRLVVHCVFILLAREKRRLRDWVMQLVLPRLAAVRLRLIWLRSADAID